MARVLPRCCLVVFKVGEKDVAVVKQGGEDSSQQDLVN